MSVLAKAKAFVAKDDPFICQSVRAGAMTRGDYLVFRGKPAEPASATAAGYVIEMQDGSAANMDGYDGHISWMPETRFLASYKASR